MKNLITILVLVAVLAGGYYFFFIRGGAEYFSENATVSQDALERTQVFIERNAVLSRLSLDVSLFEDTRFTSLKTFRQDIIPRPIGRENPFEPAEDAPTAAPPSTPASTLPPTP